MPITFAQPMPVGAAERVGYDTGIAQAYAQHAGRGGGGGGGFHGNPFPPTIPADAFHMLPAQQYGEDPVDAQLRLDQGRLSMAEEMRMQRLQGALAEVDANDQLSDEDKAGLKMQINTGLHPYQVRMAKAQMQQAELQTERMKSQAALVQSIRMGDTSAWARYMKENSHEDINPQIEEMARQEYDTNLPHIWASDDPGLQQHRTNTIRARVAELGGITRLYVNPDGRVETYGGPGGRTSGAGGGGAGTGAGTGGGPGGRAMTTEMDPRQVLSERQHIETNMRNDFKDADYLGKFDPTPYIEDLSATEMARMRRLVPEINEIMAKPNAERLKALKKLMADNHAFRTFVQGRVVNSELESRLRQQGLGPTGARLPENAQPWYHRGLPAHARGEVTPIPEAAMRESAGLLAGEGFGLQNEARANLTDQERAELTYYDQVRENIRRLPEERQRDARAKLTRAMAIFQQYRHTNNMPPEIKAEFDRLGEALEPHAVAQRPAADDTARRPGETDSQYMRRIRARMGLNTPWAHAMGTTLEGSGRLEPE